MALQKEIKNNVDFYNLVKPLGLRLPASLKQEKCMCKNEEVSITTLKRNKIFHQ
jgi:hypothetical protein